MNARNLLVSILSVVGYSLCASDCVVQPPGLVHWWPGQGSTQDAVGVAHGQLRNGATYAAGKVGEGFLLGGDGGSVFVNLDAPSGPWTLETWVKFTGNLGRGGWNTIAEFGADSPNLGVRSDGSVELWSAVNGGQITSGVWEHIAFTWDGTNSMLYLNGVQVGITTNAPPVGGHGLGIGYNDGDTPWMGLIDEVSMYNRALSAPEVHSIYLADTAGKCHPAPWPALVAAPVPYFTSFEYGIGPEWTAQSLTSYEPAFSAFAGRFDDSGLTLRLTNLVAGTQYTLGFDFYALDSWDGNGGGPDYFDVSVDGQTLLHETFSNYNGNPPNSPQSFPRDPDEGRANFGFNSYVDAIYRNISLLFTASSPTADITFQGMNLQSADDES